MKTNKLIIILLALCCAAFITVGCSEEPQTQSSEDSGKPLATVTLDISEHTMNVGDSVLITADKNCTWTVSDENVASVNNGLVTSKKLGEATVTAEYQGAKATCIITVTDELLGEPVLTLDLKSEKLVVSETTEIFPIAVFGSQIADNDELSYSVTSSNKNVVAADGFKLTGKGEGEAVITLTLNYKQKSYSVEKTITVRSVSDIWFQEKEVSVVSDNRFSLEVFGTFSDSQDVSEVSYSVSDPDVVNYENGTFVAIKTGTATVTATYKDVSDSCTVRVCNPVVNVSDFLKIYDNPSENYILLMDIDLTGKAIGKSKVDFDGYLDGNGFSIKGIAFTEWQSHLFRNVSGKIKNINFESVKINGSNVLIQTGLLAYALNGARIENCRFDVKFLNVGSGNLSEEAKYAGWGMFAGVVASYNDCAYIKNCYITVSTPHNSKDDYIGSVVGNNRGELILDNVIIEKAGTVEVSVKNTGIIVESSNAGVYEKNVAFVVAKQVFSSNIWHDSEGLITLKKGIVSLGELALYNVITEVRNINGDGYEQLKSETLFGLTGNRIEAYIPSEDIYGFTFSPEDSVTSATLDNEGTKLYLRYERNEYTVTLSYAGKTVTKRYKFREVCDLNTFGITAPQVAGKAFIGWGEEAYEKFNVTKNLILSAPVYAIEISSYDDLIKIKDNPSANYVLTNDIDATKETGKAEVIWAMINEFSGVLDGNGYSIKNVSLYNSNPDWFEKISLFDNFSGVLKDIGFDNIKCVPTKAGYKNGIIAREFSGKARNIYLNATITKTYYQYDGHQYGALFGSIEGECEVTDCFIRFKTSRNSNTTSPFGFVSGTLNSEAYIDNIVILKDDNAVNETGSIIAYYGNKARVNGVSCSVNNPAENVLSGVLIANESVVIEKSNKVLGFGWSSNGDLLPYLLKENAIDDKVVVVSNVSQLYDAIINDSSAYIILANDIECKDYVWAMVGTSFNGTINGNGYAIKNLTLSGGTSGGHTRMAMFRYYMGTIRNISFENAKIDVKGCVAINGIIASEFGGLAENIKVDVTFTNVYHHPDESNPHHSGAMFGELSSSGATIKNCLIKVTTPEDYKIGYIAGLLNNNSTISNIVVVSNAKAGPFAFYRASTANINGIVVKVSGDSGDYAASDALAVAAINGYLIGNEEEVAISAGTILGSAWVCDGTQIPYLKQN